jgi:hypothetical protein
MVDTIAGRGVLSRVLAHPVVRLPAGDWTISAVASFVEGKGCSGASRMMAATVVVHITPLAPG